MVDIKVVTSNCKDYHSEPISEADGVDSVADEISFACSDYKPINAEADNNVANVVITSRLAESGYCRGRCSNCLCERLRV